jgi:hypothetical protein
MTSLRVDEPGPRIALAGATRLDQDLEMAAVEDVRADEHQRPFALERYVGTVSWDAPPVELPCVETVDGSPRDWPRKSVIEYVVHLTDELRAGVDRELVPDVVSGRRFVPLPHGAREQSADQQGERDSHSRECAA